jgi:hypothetical protein
MTQLPFTTNFLAPGSFSKPCSSQLERKIMRWQRCPSCIAWEGRKRSGRLRGESVSSGRRASHSRNKGVKRPTVADVGGTVRSNGRSGGSGYRAGDGLEHRRRVMAAGSWASPDDLIRHALYSRAAAGIDSRIPESR